MPIHYNIVAPLLGGSSSSPKPVVSSTIDNVFPPYSNSYGNLIYAKGYTSLSPFGSFASLTLDSNTGMAKVVSPQYTNARFYWGIKISEYRNNILIGMTYATVCTVFNPLYNPNCPAVGIQDADVNNEPTVYPNPFQNSITISNLNTQVNKIELYDMSGKLQETEKISAQNQTIINFPHLPNGIYLLRFIDKEGNTVGREKVAKSN